MIGNSSLMFDGFSLFFWCLCSMSTLEATPTTEASHGSQESQKPTRNKNEAKTLKAIDCFNPEALQTPALLSHSEVSKEIPEIPRIATSCA